MKEKLYFIYILTNYTNSVLYVGITNNLKLRIYQHKTGKGPTFTNKYNVSKLVYYEIYRSPEIAILREKSIKNLLRSKKIDLINKINSKWEDLYEII